MAAYGEISWKPKGYIGVRRDVDMDMKEQDGINLIDKVIADENLWRAYKKVEETKVLQEWMVLQSIN